MPIGEIESSKVDASSTVVTNEGYLIGGRLNVQHAIKEAITLYPYLEHEQANLPKELLPLRLNNGKPMSRR